MFRLHRHKSDRSEEKVEFRFSNLQAFKVPKGWDKLFLSIVSVETGKTIAKSSRATVRGGTCQWTGVESIWISQDDASKELQESKFKFVLSMGSSRSGILGEIVLNVAEYISSEDSGPLLLPLKKCESGTALQVKIQCTTPKSKFSIAKGWQETTSPIEGSNTNDQSTRSKSDASDSIVDRSVESLSVNHLSDTSCPDELGNRDTSFLASGSHRCSDSGNDCSGTGRTNSSNGGSHVGRHDSAASITSATIAAGPEGELCRSNRSSFNSRASGSSLHMNQRQDIAVPTFEEGYPTPSLKSHHSSIDIETAEEIEELHDEVKMWERHSRQLKLDIEILKKEISDKTRHQENLDIELAAASRERDTLKQEVEQLKVALRESMPKAANTVTDESRDMIFTSKSEDMVNMQKELEHELMHLKETNANLTLQLRKNQESNVELVSIIHELEQTIEKQKMEVDNLSQKNHVTEHKGILQGLKLLDDEAEWARKLTLKEEEIFKLEEKLSNMLNSQQTSQIELNRSHSDLRREIEVLKVKVQELEKDCVELTDENLDLTLKMKEYSKDIKEEKILDGSRSSESQGFISKIELELRITELEQENVQLSECIPRLEAQLMCITYAKESDQLELENARSLVLDLKEKIEGKEAEVEMQKIEAKQKLQESQKQLLEALEESDILRRSNSKLQATIDCLIEECSSLQDLTGGLKRQKIELYEHVTHLEVELDRSQKQGFDSCKQVEFLEAALSSLERDIASKEKLLLSQLEILFQEHKEHKEKISQAHAMLKKMESDKTLKAENLQRELVHLTAQMTSNHDEQEKMASDAKEISCANEAELKSELSQIQKENSEFGERIQFLEMEKDNFMRKAQLMETEPMLKKQHDQDRKVISSEVNEKLHKPGRSHVSKVDQESNTHQLRMELAEASETNNMYKLQVKKFSTENQIDDPEVLKKDMIEDNTRANNTGTISSLEAELKDMKERYLHMSLQYAEVEAQREELVLRLKSMQKEKRWFS